MLSIPLLRYLRSFFRQLGINLGRILFSSPSSSVSFLTLQRSGDKDWLQRAIWEWRTSLTQLRGSMYTVSWIRQKDRFSVDIFVGYLRGHWSFLWLSGWSSGLWNGLRMPRLEMDGGSDMKCERGVVVWSRARTRVAFERIREGYSGCILGMYVEAIWNNIILILEIRFRFCLDFISLLAFSLRIFAIDRPQMRKQL